MSASCRRLMPFAHPPSAQSLIVTLKSLIGITSCLAVRTLTTTRYSAPPHHETHRSAADGGGAVLWGLMEPHLPKWLSAAGASSSPLRLLFSSLSRLQSHHCSGANESRFYQPPGLWPYPPALGGSKERRGRCHCECHWFRRPVGFW